MYVWYIYQYININIYKYRYIQMQLLDRLDLVFFSEIRFCAITQIPSVIIYFSFGNIFEIHVSILLQHNQPLHRQAVP